MSRYVVDGNSIVPGYPWTLTLSIQANTPYFSNTATYFSYVKQTSDYSTVLAKLSTANGNFVAVDTQNLIVTIPGTLTANLNVSQIVFDLIRTDVSPHAYVGLKLTVPVEQPVTPSTAT
ncbi:MAG: hypothetical protein P4L79_09810 [Legionella sp.]|uniref:hypothetical protein n=1 Tax=Legionella sp. TaxID=459 RepID=UPI00285024BA|nr:hypothetical protein [Legionella sp.]